MTGTNITLAKLIYVLCLALRCISHVVWVGRGSVVLRHSATHFSSKYLQVLRVEWRWTQRRALPPHQSEEMKILNISLPWVGIDPTTYGIYSHTLRPLRHDWPQSPFDAAVKHLHNIHYIEIKNNDTHESVRLPPIFLIALNQSSY